MNMGQKMHPAVVVVTYNRPEALSRILKTIESARYEQDVDIALVISVDRCDHLEIHTEVIEIANGFDWQHGQKLVIEHSQNLGLKQHVMACGDLTEKYSSIILLEDDLLVSPDYYQYAVEALSFYCNEDNISGISLYSYDFNEYAQSRFIPLEDGFDSYFIQTASSWGQAWTAAQWSAFKHWYKNCSSFESERDRLPQKLLEWSERSWKKFFIKYMILTDKYFVFPRVSLSTNSGDRGANHGGSLNYQVPLQLGRKDYRFSQLAESCSIYDAHYELEANCLKQLNPALRDVDFECDLYGTKTAANVCASYLLSIKDCEGAIASYDFAMIPQELNIAFNLEGNSFSLAKTENFAGIEARKQVAQMKGLHKNLGWKRYSKILRQTLLEKLQGN